MKHFQTICSTNDVPDGSARTFLLDGIPIGIFHVNGEFFALDDRCPHAGASLAMGMIEHGAIRCRIHHWAFCLRDGKYQDAEQPAFNAKTFPVRVVGTDVQIEI